MQWGPHEEQSKASPARTARRDRVPPGVIASQGEEEQGAEEEEASVTCTDSEDSTVRFLEDGSPQDTTRTPLSEDSHQHGLMLAAYREVALQSFESVPRRWPLARRGLPG